MPVQPSFVAELFKRQPLGVSLVLLGAIAFLFVAVSFEAGIEVGSLLGVGVVVAFLAWLVGGPLTIRAASRIRAERRSRENERTAQPWQ
jgi:hypothetical protein